MLSNCHSETWAAVGSVEGMDGGQYLQVDLKLLPRIGQSLRKQPGRKEFVCDLSLLGWGSVSVRYGDVQALVHTCPSNVCSWYAPLSDHVCAQMCMLLSGCGRHWLPFSISWL